MSELEIRFWNHHTSMVLEAMRRGELIYGKYGEYRKRWALNFSWKKKSSLKVRGSSLDEWAIWTSNPVLCVCFPEPFFYSDSLNMGFSGKSSKAVVNVHASYSMFKPRVARMKKKEKKEKWKSKQNDVSGDQVMEIIRRVRETGLYPCVLVAQSCPTLCDPMDCSLPSSSVHRILQASILEWVAMLPTISQ